MGHATLVSHHNPQKCNVILHPISGLIFQRQILGGEFLEGELFWGVFGLRETGANNPQIRVPEVQKPLCGNLSLKSPCRVHSCEHAPDHFHGRVHGAKVHGANIAFTWSVSL